MATSTYIHIHTNVLKYIYVNIWQVDRIAAALQEATSSVRYRYRYKRIHIHINIELSFPLAYHACFCFTLFMHIFTHLLRYNIFIDSTPLRKFTKTHTYGNLNGNGMQEITTVLTYSFFSAASLPYQLFEMGRGLVYDI